MTLKIDTSNALCNTHYADQAHLWDSEIDGGIRNARGETREERRRRHLEARRICGDCSQQAVCLVVGMTDHHRTGIYGGELVDELRRPHAPRRPGDARLRANAPV